MEDNGTTAVPKQPKLTKDIPDESFIEIGHDREIKHNIEWTERPEQWDQETLIPYPGNVQDATLFLHRAERALEAKLMFQEKDEYMVERHILFPSGDKLMFDLTGYTYFWELRLRPLSISKGKPAIYDVGGVALTRKNAYQTIIMIRTLEGARFYQKWIDDYYKKEMKGQFISMQPEPADRHGKTAIPKKPQPISPTTLTLSQVGELGKLISKWFSKNELRNLSLYLSLDYENLPSDTKDNLAHELVNQARRENKVPKLWGKLYEERSHVDWSQALIE